LNLADRHKDGYWAMVYLGSTASFSVRLNTLAGGNRVRAFWVDPRDAREVPIGTFANSGEQPFATPDG
jgi:hypothetical protein